MRQFSRGSCHCYCRLCVEWHLCRIVWPIGRRTQSKPTCQSRAPSMRCGNENEMFDFRSDMLAAFAELYANLASFQVECRLLISSEAMCNDSSSVSWRSFCSRKSKARRILVFFSFFRWRFVVIFCTHTLTRHIQQQHICLASARLMIFWVLPNVSHASCWLSLWQLVQVTSDLDRDVTLEDCVSCCCTLACCYLFFKWLGFGEIPL